MSIDIDIVNKTCNGNCSNCGECCSDILPLSSRDITRIKNYLKNHRIERHNLTNCFIRYNFCCPFRNDKERKCDIYEVRPEICRVFKCDIPPEKAKLNRDLIENKHPAQSMTHLFFNDSTNRDVLKIVQKSKKVAHKM